MEKLGIIPMPMGGLGNQIFIYIAGYVMSEHLKCPLYLFNNPKNNNTHSIKEYKDTIFKNLGIHVDSYFLKSENPDYLKHPINDGFDAWDFSSVKQGMILESYYQYYPILSSYENKIRDILLSGLESYKIKILEKYTETHLRNSAFLHVRRGDYLNLPYFHFIQPISYYSYCIDELLKHKPDIEYIYVFSDDINWVNSQELFSKEKFIIVDSCSDELEDITFMSLCKAGAICANSTFSWWGAFLGAYSERNKIFVPKKWINLSNKIEDLFPADWIIVKI